MEASNNAGPASTLSAWQPLTVWSQGATISVNVFGTQYNFSAATIIGAGHSGSSSPSWNVAVSGTPPSFGTTSDYKTPGTDGVVWQCLGPSAMGKALDPNSYLMLNAILLVPTGAGQAAPVSTIDLELWTG